MNEALDIVVVDDNPDDLKWMSRLSKGLSTSCTVHTLPNSDQLESILLDHTPSVVFVDHNLGTDNGIDLIRQFHNHFPDIAFVLISGLGNERVMTDAIRAGASDFLRKEEIDAKVLDELVDRISQNLFRHQYARLALTVLNEGIITADASHRILRCNPAVENLTGLSEIDLKGVSLEKLFHPEDDEIIQTLFTLSDSLWDSQPELRIVNSSGEVHTVTMVVNSLVAARNKIYIVVIKQYLNTDRDLQSIDKQLAIINQTSDFIGYTNASGEIQFMNPATKELLNIDDKDETARLTLFDVFTPTMRRALAVNIFPQLARSGHYVGNGLVNKKTGGSIPVSIVMNGLCTSEGELETITFILREITSPDIEL